MRRVGLFALRLLPFAFLLACTPPELSENKTDGAINLDYRNKKVQRLYDFRDQNRTDSLVRYLNHPDATLRYLAALAFASVKDSNAVEPLANLLRDPSEEVRIAAAFSLGQIGSGRAERHLVGAFMSGDSLSRHQKFNATILEAIGRCGTAANLKNLAAISTYRPTDTLLLEGQCRGIYRYALRGMTTPEATAKMVGIVADEKMPERVRVVAANYLARAKDIAPDSLQAVKMAVGYVRALDPGTRMALARGLGKSKTGPAFGILSKVIATERDWRVKCNIINALAKFDYDTVRSLVVPFIQDPNPHVARTAAEFFIQNGRPQDGDFYWRIARDNPNLPWETAVALYRASNKWLSGKAEPESKEYVIYRLKDLYQQNGRNPYLRAACIAALGESPWQYRWIHDRGFSDPHPAVKSAACEVLAAICHRPDFYAYFGEGARGARRELYHYLREAVAGGDAGMIAAGAEGFRAKALNYNELRDSARLDDLRASLSKLKLPRDIEAYQALEKAVAYFEGQPEPPARKPDWSHPIEWPVLATMKAEAKVALQTKYGSVVLALYPQWAPGSVANFLKLANEGFFNGKTFHRVVPNFVVQGGCPRGDGYGALDYAIRTEIGPLQYDSEGWVGMASAGKDTEGTQFFITHSAAPHLDGNYTIFAKVVQGMEFVHQIQIGDVIEKAVVQ